MVNTKLDVMQKIGRGGNEMFGRSSSRCETSEMSPSMKSLSLSTHQTSAFLLQWRVRWTSVSFAAQHWVVEMIGGGNLH